MKTSSIDPGNPIGALEQTLASLLNLVWLYVVAALLLRQPRTTHPEE